MKPGLAAGLPPDVRARIGAAAGTDATRFDALGQELVTPLHFNLDPALKRLRRYRSSSAAATRYLTVRLAADGTILGVLVEDE